MNDSNWVVDIFPSYIKNLDNENITFSEQARMKITIQQQKGQ